MQLPDYVKPKPEILGILPIIGNRTANSIYPFILLPRPIYEALQEEKPDLKLVALLIHRKLTEKDKRKWGGLNSVLSIFLIKNFALTKNFWQ